MTISFWLLNIDDDDGGGTAVDVLLIGDDVEEAGDGVGGKADPPTGECELNEW